MLRFEGLSKAYEGRPVFRRLSHHFECGAYALQGPNGIGKSTLLALLAGALTPDAGEIWIEGSELIAEPRLARGRLSYVPDECPVYPFMQGRSFLSLVCRAKQVELGQGILDIVAGFGLSSHLETRFDAMSLGMQKKFMLSAAWIGDPGVMLVDEPSNGLDQAARDFLVRLIKERQPNSVVLFSTHDADFVTACGAQVVNLGELIARLGA